MPVDLLFWGPAEDFHEHFGVVGTRPCSNCIRAHETFDSSSSMPSAPLKSLVRKPSVLGSFLSSESYSPSSRFHASWRTVDMAKCSHSSFLFTMPSAARPGEAPFEDLRGPVRILKDGAAVVNRIQNKASMIDDASRTRTASKVSFAGDEDDEEQSIDCVQCCNKIGSCVTPDFHQGKSECCFKCGGCLLASKGMTPDWQERLEASNIAPAKKIPMGSEQGRPGEGEEADKFKAIKTRNKGERTGIIGALGILAGAWMGRMGKKFKAFVGGAFKTGGSSGSGVGDSAALGLAATQGVTTAAAASAKHSLNMGKRLLMAPMKRINRKFGRFMDKIASAIHSALGALQGAMRRKGPHPIFELKYSGELGLLVEYQSPTVAHTTLGDSESWTCQAYQKASAGAFGAPIKEQKSLFAKLKTKALKKARGFFSKFKNKLMGGKNMAQKTAALPPPGDLPVYGTGTLEPIPDLSHPSITFREPQNMVHVHLEDTNSGLVHWDATYNLRGSRILPKLLHTVEGEQPDFIPFCPPKDDPPHVYHLFLSKAASSPTPTTHDFIGKVIVRAYEADGHDPEDYEYSGGLISKKMRDRMKRQKRAKLL